MAVVTAKVVMPAPCPDQGESAAKPTPEPKEMRIRVADAATKAPAMIDGHDAAERGAGAPASIATAAPEMMISSMILSLAVRTHRQQQNDRERNAQHPE